MPISQEFQHLREDMQRGDDTAKQNAQDFEKKLKELEDKLDRVEDKVDIIYGFLLQGKGAMRLVRSVLWLAGLVGFASFSQEIAKLLLWLGGTNGGGH